VAPRTERNNWSSKLAAEEHRFPSSSNSYSETLPHLSEEKRSFVQPSEEARREHESVNTNECTGIDRDLSKGSVLIAPLVERVSKTETSPLAEAAKAYVPELSQQQDQSREEHSNRRTGFSVLKLETHKHLSKLADKMSSDSFERDKSRMLSVCALITLKCRESSTLRTLTTCEHCSTSETNTVVSSFETKPTRLA
jgi:hypothetical protein